MQNLGKRVKKKNDVHANEFKLPSPLDGTCGHQDFPIQPETPIMPRLFVVFRTYDRTWDSAVFTREFSPLELDTSAGGINLLFHAEHIAGVGRSLESKRSIYFLPEDFYVQPHRGHAPIFFGLKSFSLQHCRSRCCQSAPIYPYSHSDILEQRETFKRNDVSDNSSDSVSYFVLPIHKCTIVMDAHVASCLKSEFSRSRGFRRRFFHRIQHSCGYRNCMMDYQQWSEEQRNAWDNYLTIPFMLDVIAVWPWQKIDHGWSDRILNLVNKHVMLEESLAWLSTLGGAHSSLGETFLDHAERAGEISVHQLKLARELGNEIIIARCYLYWAWSLLQRDYLAQCKICILNTWKYVKKIKCSDKVLTNMCKAVWSRLQYKRSLLDKSKGRCNSANAPKDDGYSDADGSACSRQQHTGRNQDSKRSRIGMHPVEVC